MKICEQAVGMSRTRRSMEERVSISLQSSLVKEEYYAVCIVRKVRDGGESARVGG